MRTLTLSFAHIRSTAHISIAVVCVLIGTAITVHAAQYSPCPDLILDGWNYSPVGSGWTHESCWEVGVPPWVTRFCTTSEYRNYENEFGWQLTYNCSTGEWV
jgi:hypothetical protein